jgi:orotidine-5'-phosphate decarboxylase
VGLDPDIKFFPDFLSKNAQTSSNESIAEVIYEFNKIVIDAVAEHTRTFKRVNCH